MDPFRTLGISEPLLRALRDEGFERPSMVQEKAIPLVLAGKDVIAGSATGSGKTLAFGAGIIDRCPSGAGIRALVLTPTRELAEQIGGALKKFSRYKPLAVTVVYGGVSINPQIEALKTADVVVGTPGRILDHMERSTIRFSDVHILVLDEADRMLDMGFIDDVEKIIRACPEQRQTLLFSATIPYDIMRLAKKYMKNPVKVSAETQVDPQKLTQVYYDVEDNTKFSLLVHLLKHEKAGIVMVFCNSRKTVDFVANNLRPAGVNALAIHGGFSQDKRTRTLQQFHAQKVTVLVCTDVAARGLDIQNVSHVYNYDIPKESKQYIHRIGRTARAGKEGKAINILTHRDWDNFTRVLRDNHVDIIKEQTPRVHPVRIQWRDAPRSRFREGRPHRQGPHRSRSPGRY